MLSSPPLTHTQVLLQLEKPYPGVYTGQNVVLSTTHTHSGTAAAGEALPWSLHRTKCCPLHHSHTLRYCCSWSSSTLESTQNKMLSSPPLTHTQVLLQLEKICRKVVATFRKPPVIPKIFLEAVFMLDFNNLREGCGFFYDHMQVSVSKRLSDESVFINCL
jgi:hypothetical protein